MLNNKEFDLWADNYDKSVDLSDEDGTYPFAGYKIIINEIYKRVLNSKAKNILDIGFGTGTLTTKLYERGCNIYGQDFSQKMIEMAKTKMPKARLYQGDFSKTLVEPLLQHKYDAIIATYSLHHLKDKEKVELIHTLLSLLNEGGAIYIGDVAFETRKELQKCKEKAGNTWDEEEIYFVLDELREIFVNLKFEKFSNCSGLITIRK